nr:EpsI family protein [candidate division Zixibacteria bacterium]
MKGKLLISIMLIMVGGIIGNGLRFIKKLPDRRAEFTVIPNRLPGYFGAEQQIDDMACEAIKGDVTTLRDFVTVEGQRFQLFMAYFTGKESAGEIYSAEYILPRGGWRIDSSEAYTITMPGNRTFKINRLIISVNKYRMVMLYWYEARSGMIRSECGLRAALFDNSMMIRPTDVALIRLTIDATNIDTKTATEKGLRFFQQSYGYIEQSLPF